jgi:DNA-binding transcriptional regulator YiaG
MSKPGVVMKVNSPKGIKALRKTLGLTQTEMAKYLGTSYVSVNRWERGWFRPSQLARAALQRLAESH